VHEAVGQFATDVEAGMIQIADASIGGLGPFENNIRPVMLVKSKESFVQVGGGLFQYAQGDVDTGGLQFFDALAIDLYKGIAATDDDPGYAVAYDEVGAWGCFAMMGTGLQGHVQGRLGDEVPVGLCHGINAIGLGMGPAILPVKPLADDAALVHKHGSHHGVGRCVAGGLTGQLQATVEVCFVGCQ